MWPSHPGAGWQGQLIERPSSAVGKPGVKPDAPSALERGRQKQRFPLESADKDQPRRPANQNTDPDVADLTNPKFPALNRFSNPNLHSCPQM